jgi:1,4-alpha-glucan branching enzyme
MHVALVLHTHLPWLRRAGTHPVGEEWLFQAWSESYLPLLAVLERLAADGARDLLSVGVTPVLGEQLDDPYLLDEFEGWLARRLLDLQYTVSRYGASDRARLAGVWSHHWRHHTRLLEQFRARRRDGGLSAPLRALADAGVIELLGGPQTHPYLALMDDWALATAQIEGGLDDHAARFGRRPKGVWTPECGYRPAGDVGDPTRPTRGTDANGSPVLHRLDRDLPGVEAWWAAAGATHLVLDGPTLQRATGDGVPDHPVLIGDSPVAAFGRDLDVTYAVWNPTGGYPSDPAYRDFHTVDLEGGFKSWRVSGGAYKEPYDPVHARERAVAHAEDFVALLRRHAVGRDPDAVVVAAYDTELFGHWWHEGPVWLETVLRRLVDDPALAPTTLAGYLDRHPARQRLDLPESSWGWRKGHASWVGDATRPMWRALRAAERRYKALPAGQRRDVAWRQLALAQASDWPFMTVRGGTAQYARERLSSHLERFEAACRGEDLDASTDRDGPLRALG